MSKKVFGLISVIVTAVQSVSIELVDFFECAHSKAIDESIVVAGSAIITICGFFTINEEVKKYKALSNKNK